MQGKSGKLVELADGRRGVVYNDDPKINGKLCVYIISKVPTDTKRILADPEKLKHIGFIN